MGWEDDDMKYLKEAEAAVSKEFWELVSKKMMHMGCKKKIPSESCQNKWRELEGQIKYQRRRTNPRLKGKIRIINRKKCLRP